MDPREPSPLGVEPPPEVSARIRAEILEGLRPSRGLSTTARQVVGLGACVLVLATIYVLLSREGLAGSGHALRALLGGVVLLATGSLWSLGRSGSARVSIATRLVFAVTPLALLFLLTAVSVAWFPDAQGIPRTGVVCFKNGVIISVLPMVALLALWRRTDPFTPRLTGALVGGFAGFTGATALVMGCPSKDPVHLFVAHGAAVAVGSLFGALVGRRLLCP